MNQPKLYVFGTGNAAVTNYYNTCFAIPMRKTVTGCFMRHFAFTGIENGFSPVLPATEQAASGEKRSWLSLQAPVLCHHRFCTHRLKNSFHSLFRALPQQSFSYPSPPAYS